MGVCMYSEWEKGTVLHKNLPSNCTEDEHSPLLEKSATHGGSNFTILCYKHVINHKEFKCGMALLLTSHCQRAAKVGRSAREGDLGATSDSKVGRGCDLRDKEHSPTVSQKKEQSRSSDVNWGQPTVGPVIAGQVHKNKASLMVSQDIKLARQGRDHHGKRPGISIPTIRLGRGPELKCRS